MVDLPTVASIKNKGFRRVYLVAITLGSLVAALAITPFVVAESLMEGLGDVWKGLKDFNRTVADSFKTYW